MLHVTLFAVVLTVVAPQDVPGPGDADRKTYEAVKIKAGRDPAAMVKLALWCEAHGLTAERLKHLTEAIGIEPANAAAQGLLGLISYRGELLSPDSVLIKRKSDTELSKKLEAYYPRRSALEASLKTFKDDNAGRRKAAIAHEKLGAWCLEQGLKDEAIAHFNTAVQIDPYLDAPWKRLGYVKHHGRWMTREKILEEEREALTQRKADRQWEASLKKWKGQLLEKKRRQEAEELLEKVTEVRAVPSIMRVFGIGSETDQSRAVTMLANIDGPESSKALARLAVYSDGEERASAIGTLKKREPRDFVGLLIEMFQDPVQFKVQPIQGPGTRGGLLIDTPRFTLLRTYDAPPAFDLASSFRGAIVYDSDGMPIVFRGVDLDRMKLMNDKNQLAIMHDVKVRSQQFMMEANIKAAAAQQRILADVGAIEAFNNKAAAVNERVLPALQQAAGSAESTTDQDGLYKWWYDRLGYSYQPPQKVETVMVDVFPQSYPPSLTTCFAAGTKVRTIEGYRPIEEIVVGEQVLSQNVATGGLDFRPVLMVHHNAPNQTLRITLSDDEILLASVYHRFWRAGTGWAQARDLNPGDVLRTLGSTVRVISVEPGAVEPLYNLDVANNRSFFAGNAGVLVHDNTLPPVREAVFDAPPDLNAVPQGARASPENE